MDPPRGARPAGAGSSRGSPAWPPRSRATHRPPSPRRAARRDPRLRWWPRRRSQRLLEHLGRPPALVLGRNQSEADVPRSRGPEEFARRYDDAVLEQARDDVVRHLDPEVHARAARSNAKAAALEGRGDDLALPPVRLAGACDVLLVLPGDDRRPLDEFLWCCADGGAKSLQRGDQVRRGGNETRPVAGHRRTLRQRLEHDDVPAVANLQRRDRRLVEPP